MVKISDLIQNPNIERFIEQYLPPLSNLAWTPEIFWGFAAFCFFIANLQIYYRLQKQIAELSAEEANIGITINENGIGIGHNPPSQKTQCAQRNINPYGFDDNGLPGFATIWGGLKVNNSGFEEGTALLELTQAKGKLPSPFQDEVIAENSSVQVKSRKNSFPQVNLYYCIRQIDPEGFAKVLKQLSRREYRIKVGYSFELMNKTVNRTFELRGNFDPFCQEVIKYWKNSGLDNLVDIYKNTKTNNLFSRFL